MATFYHVTKKKHLRKILQQGLTPQIGELARYSGETESRIYLFPDIQSMNTALGSWLGLYYEDKYPEDMELYSLEIMLPEDFPITDGEAEYEKYSYTHIPAEYIRYLKDE